MVQGLGKRVTVDQFRLQKRGGVGLKSIKVTEGDSLAAIATVRPAATCTNVAALIWDMPPAESPHYHPL